MMGLRARVPPTSTGGTSQAAAYHLAQHRISQHLASVRSRWSELRYHPARFTRIVSPFATRHTYSLHPVLQRFEVDGTHLEKVAPAGYFAKGGEV